VVFSCLVTVLGFLHATSCVCTFAFLRLHSFTIDPAVPANLYSLSVITTSTYHAYFLIMRRLLPAYLSFLPKSDTASPFLSPYFCLSLFFHHHIITDALSVGPSTPCLPVRLPGFSIRSPVLVYQPNVDIMPSCTTSFLPLHHQPGHGGSREEFVLILASLHLFSAASSDRRDTERETLNFSSFQKRETLNFSSFQIANLAPLFVEGARRSNAFRFRCDPPPRLSAHKEG
jgi:hypothetical protein